MTFQTQQIIGVDFTTNTEEALFTPGTITWGSDGSKWMYVQASAAVTQYYAVGIEMDTYTCAPLTKAMADAGRYVGAAQVALTSDYYGWVQLAGQGSVALRNACLPNVPLYTSAVAGLLDDTSGSQTRVYGIRSTDTATASAAAKVCWIQGIVT